MGAGLYHSFGQILKRQINHLPQCRKCQLFLCFFLAALFIFAITTNLCSKTQSPKNVIIIYNRVPKTGSTSLVRIFRHLSASNGFKIYQIVIYNPTEFLSPLQHRTLVEEAASMSRYDNLFIHGHFYHINFRKYGIFNKYIYINLLRDPLDRLISKYYFVRFGGDFKLGRPVQNITFIGPRRMSFDECVLNNGTDCHPTRLWIQIPFFCGSSSYCRTPGNRQALEAAKRRLIEEYLLVGVLEYFDEFIELLSQLLPNFLNGVESTKHVSVDGIPLWHLRRTKLKPPIVSRTLKYFHNNTIWQMEEEFYEFARAEFLSRYKSFKNKLFDVNIWHDSLFKPMS